MLSDTHPEADAVQRAVYRRMTASERLGVALELSVSIREVARAGLRARRPELSAAELERELLRIVYGFVPPE